MKYLKLFESTTTDLEDILLELKDNGYIIISDVVSANNNSDPIYNTIGIRAPIGFRYSLKWNVIKDYALRIKDYLGTDYIGFSYRDKVNMYRTDIPNGFISSNVYYKKMELNEYTEIPGNIYSFIIKYYPKFY